MPVSVQARQVAAFGAMGRQRLALVRLAVAFSGQPGWAAEASAAVFWAWPASPRHPETPLDGRRARRHSPACAVPG